MTQRSVTQRRTKLLPATAVQLAAIGVIGAAATAATPVAAAMLPAAQPQAGNSLDFVACGPCAAKSPSAAKAAANPCAAKAAANPCAAKNPCSPCAAKNPCSAKN